MVQVFVNLLNNACDASVNDKTIFIRSRKDDNNINIEVIDQGKGISAADKKRLFEPFFTTKKAGKGMGLGLSIVYNIMRDHGGTIKVHNNTKSHPKKGTVFLISLINCESVIKNKQREPCNE